MVYSTLSPLLTRTLMVLACVALISGAFGGAARGDDVDAFTRAEGPTVHVECGYRDRLTKDRLSPREAPRSYGSGAIVKDRLGNFYVLTAMHVTLLEEPGSEEFERYCLAYPNGPNASSRYDMLEPQLPEPEFNEGPTGAAVIPTGVPDAQLFSLSVQGLAVTPFKICDASETIRRNDKIYVFGYQGERRGENIEFGLESWYPRTGVLRDMSGGGGAWRTDLNFVEGESGGPITDGEGRLIGIIRGRRSSRQSHFLPIGRFASKLQDTGIDVSGCAVEERPDDNVSTSTENGSGGGNRNVTLGNVGGTLRANLSSEGCEPRQGDTSLSVRDVGRDAVVDLSETNTCPPSNTAHPEE